jgi:hypothetical protein
MTSGQSSAVRRARALRAVTALAIMAAPAASPQAGIGSPSLPARTRSTLCLGQLDSPCSIALTCQDLGLSYSEMISSPGALGT